MQAHLVEYWDAATETAWICEPTTPYHERPTRLLTRLAERIAGVRGSPIECYGSMDLLLRDAGGEPISQLGLTPVGTTRSLTAIGTVERSIYSEVRFTVLGRSGTLEVTNLPDGAPVLVGHMVMELLDLAVDMQRGLTYNPAHDGKWIEEQL